MAKQVEPLSKADRRQVDEYLAGCKTVREGIFPVYFIKLPDETVRVTTHSVDADERQLRERFGPAYPEIAP